MLFIALTYTKKKDPDLIKKISIRPDPDPQHCSSGCKNSIVKMATGFLKGTVSRDFRPSVFFINQYPWAP
jgi:hypothetical protein